MEGILNHDFVHNGPSSAMRIPYLLREFERRPMPSDHYPAILDDLSSVDLASFLQAWLFFGLLSEFFQVHVNPLDFTNNDMVDLNQPGSHIYFRDWAARLGNGRQDQRDDELQRIDILLNRASFLSNLYDSPAQNSLELNKIALSIKLLISLLQRISEDTCVPESLPEANSVHFNWASYLLGLGIVRKRDRITQMTRKQARIHLARDTKQFRPLCPGDNRAANNRYSRAAQYLLDIFIHNGWCPHQARQICLSYDYLIANLFAGYRRPGDEDPAPRHLACFGSPKCVAFNIIPGRPYPFWHVNDDNCAFVTVNRSEIEKIINEGGIPLISIDANADDPDMKIVKCTAWTTYTAISHVWSDGLGNPDENRIFLCQLLRLRKMIRENSDPDFSPFFNATTNTPRWLRLLRWYIHKINSPGKPLRNSDKKRINFWMDTLCIPVKTAHDNHDTVKEIERLKGEALKQITPIYAGASEVLVLDRVLENLKPQSHPIHPSQCAIHILSSTWMQRGWTLEEGSLAQSCVFRMADKPYEMGIVTDVSRLKRIPDWIQSPFDKTAWKLHEVLPTILGKELGEEKRKLTTEPPQKTNHLETIMRIPHFVRSWNSLLGRSTTHEADGVIILTNLLDFNVSPLLRAPEDRRLPLLIKSCAEVPASLMFTSSERVCVSGPTENQWVPLGIEGPRLVSGAFWRVSKKSTKQRYYQLDWNDCRPGQFLIFITHFRIPHETTVFSLRNEGKDYFIEIQSPMPNLVHLETEESDFKTYNQSQRTVVIIDVAAGTNSPHSFIGMGARFSVTSISSRELAMSFDRSLVVYTSEQWKLRMKSFRSPISDFTSEMVDHKRKVFLQFGERTFPQNEGSKVLKHKTDVEQLAVGLLQLKRRPLLTQRPFGPTLISSLLLILIVAATFSLITSGFLADLFTWISNLAPWSSKLLPWISKILIIILARVFYHLVHAPMRRRLAMYTYKSWLHTFSEDFSKPKTRLWDLNLPRGLWRWRSMSRSLLRYKNRRNFRESPIADETVQSEHQRQELEREQSISLVNV